MPGYYLLAPFANNDPVELERERESKVVLKVIKVYFDIIRSRTQEKGRNREKSNTQNCLS